MADNSKLLKMIDSRIGSIEKKKTLGGVDQFLPKTEEVETRVLARDDLLSQGLADLGDFFTDRESVAGKLPEGLLKTFGGAFQRGEASLANMAELLQLGDVSRGIPDAFLQGLSGERLGQLGDLVRRTGVELKGPNVLGFQFKLSNEVISNAVGFAGMAGLSNLTTAGKLSQGTNKMISSLKTTAKRQAVKGARKKAGFFKMKAEQFLDGINDAFGSMRHEFQKLFDDIGDNVLSGDDAVEFTDIMVRTPTRVVSKVKRLEEARGTRIILPKTKQPAQFNIRTANDLQKEIGRSIPRDVWNGFRGAVGDEITMVDDYFKLGDVIAKNANKGINVTDDMLRLGSDPKSILLRLNAKMSRLHKANQKIRPILQTKSGITKTTIKDVFTTGRQGELAELTRFSNQFFKQGKSVLRDIGIYNRNQAILKGLRLTGGVAAGVGAVRAGVGAPIARAIGGIETSGGTSEGE